jgi:Tol biopolymer transport system component
MNIKSLNTFIIISLFLAAVSCSDIIDSDDNKIELRNNHIFLTKFNTNTNTFDIYTRHPDSGSNKLWMSGAVLHFAPRGRKIIYMRYSGELSENQHYAISNLDNNNIRPIGDMGDVDYPIISPDYSRLMYYSGNLRSGYALYAAPLGMPGYMLTRYASDHHDRPHCADFSPTNRIVYASNSNAKEIFGKYVYTADQGGNSKELIYSGDENVFQIHAVQWFPDAVNLLILESFGKNDEEFSSLIRLNTETGRIDTIQRFLSGRIKMSSPSISPDGSRIALHYNGNGVMLIDSDGGNLRYIHESSDRVYFVRPANISWAPSGTAILFVSDSKGRNLETANLYLYNLTNNSLQTIVDDRMAKNGFFIQPLAE